MQAIPTADEEPKTGVTSKRGADATSLELSARRTGLSFQRTRMSADRTLMSIIRTSLSLIGFGFTIFQFFQKLQESDVIKRGTARHFGTSLLILGCLMLLGGIAYHVAFMLDLRRTRRRMKEEGLVHAESPYPASLTLITALLLLVLGVLGALGIVLRVGPFQ
jgi:putative membrane protein